MWTRETPACHIGTSVSQEGITHSDQVPRLKTRARVSERELARSLLPPRKWVLFDCDWEILNFSGCRVYFNFVWNYTKFSPLVLPHHTHLAHILSLSLPAALGCALRDHHTNAVRGKVISHFSANSAKWFTKIERVGEKTKWERDLCFACDGEAKKFDKVNRVYKLCGWRAWEGDAGEDEFGRGTTDQYLSPLFFFGVVKCSWSWFLSFFLWMSGIECQIGAASWKVV